MRFVIVRHPEKKPQFWCPENRQRHRDRKWINSFEMARQEQPAALIFCSRVQRTLAEKKKTQNAVLDQTRSSGQRFGRQRHPMLISHARKENERTIDSWRSRFSCSVCLSFKF
jgi:hypothetical protein